MIGRDKTHHTCWGTFEGSKLSVAMCVKTRVREALSSYIYRRTKRSPMILPILMEV